MTDRITGGMLRARALEPFGIEIDHDLSRPLSTEQSRHFRDLFREHGLIVAHRQSLDREQHNRALAYTGRIVDQREGESGLIATTGEEEIESSALCFHADAAYTKTPFEALSLHAVEIVDGASSTRFVNVESAIEALPRSLRTLLETHDADMMPCGLESLARPLCDQAEPEDPGYRETLPAIRVNPRTCRPYVAVSEMQTNGLAGMNREEARDVLHAVFDHLYAPQRIYEHIWNGGDLVIWDNLACQHSRPCLKSAGRRVLQRVIVGPETHASRRSGKSPATSAVR